MAMDPPDGTFPSSVTSSGTQMPENLPDPSINKRSWDQLLNNRGIKFLHRKAVACPNVQSLDANNHEPDCTVCDQSGILYYEEKEIIGSFSSNSLEKQFERQGVWDMATALVSMQTQYADGTEADFNTFDQLVIQDYTIRLFERKEYEPRTARQQALRYSIDKIDYMASASGSSVTTYVLNTDFTIVDGKIQWVNGRQPSYNSSTERGEVLSISYYANPVYIVVQPLRELRVTQQMVAGVKTAVRLPQLLLVKRDFLPQGAEKIQE